MIFDEVTKDFLECFHSKEQCTGIMAALIASGELPEGVDPANPEVQQVVVWCKERCRENSRT